jgi:hypothetical protein
VAGALGAGPQERPAHERTAQVLCDGKLTLKQGTAAELTYKRI